MRVAVNFDQDSHRSISKELLQATDSHRSTSKELLQATSEQILHIFKPLLENLNMASVT